MPYINEFLELPHAPPTKKRRTHQPLIDFSKSIIMSSDDYIAAMEQKATQRELAEAEREKKKEEAEKAKVERRKKKEQKELEKKRKQAETQARKAAKEMLEAQKRAERALRRPLGRAGQQASNSRAH